MKKNITIEDGTRRECRIQPDHAFWVDGNEELCHHIGEEEFYDGVWWGVYIGSDGEEYLGN